MQKFHSLACLVILLLAPSVVRAESTVPVIVVGQPNNVPPAPAEDEIATRSGTMYRGRVTDVRMDTMSLSIQTDDKLESVAWKEIVSAHGPSFPASDASTEAPGRGETLLRFVSSRKQPVDVMWGMATANAQGLVTGGRLYRVHCLTDCTLAVPVGRVLVRTEHRPRSLPVEFNELHVPAEGMTVRVHTPNEDQYIASNVVMLIGSSLISTSAVITLGFLAVDPKLTQQSSVNGLIATGIMGASGLGVLGIGALVDLGNARGVTQIQTPPALPQFTPSVLLRAPESSSQSQ